jgi:hypothetical protein
MAAAAMKHEVLVTWLLKNGANAQVTIDDFITAAAVSKQVGASAKQTALITSRPGCNAPISAAVARD